MTTNEAAARDLNVAAGVCPRTWLFFALWTAAVAGLAMMFLWPIATGMVSCCDDIAYSRTTCVRGGSLWDNLKYWWVETRQFRPIDALSYYFVNLKTLDARPTLLLHLPALAAIFAAIWVALKRLAPYCRLYFPLAVLCWCLHPSTYADVWQHDTISQTWAAACGLWLALVAWEAIERAWCGQPTCRQAVTLLLLCVPGVLAKEVFFGWVAAVGALLLLTGFVALRQRKWQTAKAMVGLLIIIAIIPTCYLALRWCTGGIGALVSSKGTERYHASFGANLVLNGAMAVAGYFTTGPIHVLRDPQTPLALKVVPLLAIGLNGLLCAGPWLIAWLTRRGWPAQPDGKKVAAIAMVTFLGISATLPMARISELYLMGPNAGFAILAAIGFVGWRQLLWPSSGEHTHLTSKAGRAAFVTAAVVLLGFGVYGVASRAVHFRITWSYASTLNDILLDHQRSLPPDKDRIATVYLPPACTQGLAHSQYVEPPADALHVSATEAWFNQLDPLRRIKLARGEPSTPLAPGDMVVDCTRLITRPHW